jgi:hypothetical protein
VCPRGRRLREAAGDFGRVALVHHEAAAIFADDLAALVDPAGPDAHDPDGRPTARLAPLEDLALRPQRVADEDRVGQAERVPAANSALKCTWLVLQVSSVNHVLSVSEIVRPRRLRYTPPTSRSS